MQIVPNYLRGQKVLASNPASLLSFPFWGGGEESLVSTVCACASFSQKSGNQDITRIFRHTIVIINGRGCTTSTMLHASYSSTRAPLLLLFVSPWRNLAFPKKEQHTLDGKDVSVCLPNWL